MDRAGGMLSGIGERLPEVMRPGAGIRGAEKQIR